MNNHFNNKVVIVTGASKGIGRCIVYKLLSFGAKVAGVARSKNLLDEIYLGKNNSNGEFLAVKCDVGDRKAVDSAAVLV